MQDRSSGEPSRQTDLTLLVALFLAEIALAVSALALYKKADRSFVGWLPTGSGMVFVASVVLLLGAGGVIGRQYVTHVKTSSRLYTLTVAMNLLTVGALLLAGEITTRLLAREALAGRLTVGNTLLFRNWDAVARHYLDLIEKASGDLSYQVYDDVMGWVVGPSRRSANGLYFSSVEGLRASRQGLSYRDDHALKIRIALIGDSFTFCEQVRFEDSWGDILQRTLGDRVQVLNFSVPGYGVDQAYLRYEKEVRAWKPDIVVFGIPRHDVVRTMTLYSFIDFPYWDMPFSKPRFVLESDTLTTLNVPPLAPRDMFSKQDIADLPYLDYDRGYNEGEWHSHLFPYSYLARYVAAAFPRWPKPNPNTSAESLVSVNAAIVRSFVRSAREAGSVPLIVYLAENTDFTSDSLEDLVWAKAVLKEAEVDYTDTTPCLRALTVEDAFMPNDPHYSPKGNAAVAACLTGQLQQIIGTLQPTPLPAP